MATKAQGNIGSKGKLTRHPPEELASQVAHAIVEGNGSGLRTTPLLGPVSEEDRRRLARITGETVEVFNERISQRLRTLADKAMDRVEETLDSKGFKSGELAFVMTSALDKLQMISGRSQVQNASIGTVINVFGSTPKESIIAALTGLPQIPPKALTIEAITDVTHTGTLEGANQAPFEIKT